MSENTKVCPKCKEKVQKGASKCKHCGADLRSRWKRHPIMSLFFGLLFLGVIFSSLGSDTETDDKQEEPKQEIVKTFKKDPMELCIYSQQEIEPLLKSPSTAQFPTCSNTNLEGRNAVKLDVADMFVYQGYVDAQNSFGAMVREEFRCKIEYKEYPEYTINCTIASATTQQELKAIYQEINVPQIEIDKF